jgi:hypothetical protein
MSGQIGRWAAGDEENRRICATHRPEPPLIGKSLCLARRAPILNASMRRTATVCVILALSWVQAAADPRNSWNKIRYRGGTVVARIDSWDWNTTLTVKPDEIVVLFAPRTTLRIKPSQVDSISYGQEAHRRIGDIVALSIVLGPLALFGLLRHNPDHLVGIVYHTDDGKKGAILLESPFYWGILQALKTVTGKPVDITP